MVIEIFNDFPKKNKVGEHLFFDTRRKVFSSVAPVYKRVTDEGWSRLWFGNVDRYKTILLNAGYTEGILTL